MKMGYKPSIRQEVGAKSIKALNHREHREHKGKEKLFFVLFVVPFFSGLFATTSKAGMQLAVDSFS